MSKPVLDTIEQYTRSPKNRRALDTHTLELDLCDLMVRMRHDAGLTQEELAKRLGYSQAYVAKMENGAYDRAGIGTLRLFALALGFDVDLDHMFKPGTNHSWSSHPTNAINVVYCRHDTLSSNEPVGSLVEISKSQIFVEVAA